MNKKNQHVIQGKWVDCKSAIPMSEMFNNHDYFESDKDSYYSTHNYYGRYEHRNNDNHHHH